jgi:hypothetical protein
MTRHGSLATLLVALGTLRYRRALPVVRPSVAAHITARSRQTSSLALARAGSRRTSATARLLSSSAMGARP